MLLTIKHFILAVFIFGYSSVTAQQVPDLIFTNLTTRDGLSNNAIHCITQDSSSFIWIGTDDGLNRFDGKRFKIYRHDPLNNNSLPHSDIRLMTVEKTGLLWVSTAKGLCLFNPYTDSFTNFSHIRGRPFIDHMNNLWVGSDSGLLNFDRKTNQFEKYDISLPEELKNKPNASAIGLIFEDYNHQLWCTSDYGIYSFNRQTKKFTFFANKFSVVTQYFSVPSSPKERYYIAQWGNGLSEFNPQSLTPFTKVSIRESPSDIFLSVITYPIAAYPRSVFAGTDKGLVWYDPDSRQSRVFTHNISNPNSIASNQVNNFFKDNQNNLWIATPDGVSILNPQLQLFRNLRLSDQQLPGKRVVAGSVNNYFDDGQMQWLCLWHAKGIAKYDRNWKLEAQWNTVPPFSKRIGSKTIYDICKETENQFWFCTDWGIVKLNVAKNQFKLFVPEETFQESSRHYEFRKIIPFGKDKFWIRSWNWGVFVFDKRLEKFTRHYLHSKDDEHSLAHNEVKDIVYDLNGTFFVSTVNGLSEYRPVTDDFLNHRFMDGDRPGGMKNYFGRMEADRENHLWICTTLGLLRYNTRTQLFTQFTTADGLPNNNCFRICSDKNGNLWITTHNGLSFYHVQKNSFTNFYIEDGLPLNFFDGALNTTWDGKILAGYTGGLVLIDPDNLPNNPTIPPVQISSIKVMNQNMHYLIKENGIKEIRLKHYQNVLAFSFSVLNFTNPARNKYFYQLSGFDKDWRQSEDGNIIYTNLGPGTYILKVKGSNNSAIMNEDGDTLHIIITPALWQTNWFKLAACLLLVTGCWLLFRRRIKAIRHEAELKQKIAETEMQALRAQMNPHFIFNCINNIDALIQSNDKYQATVYLNKFAKLIRNILDSSKHNTVTLSKDMETLKLYIELEQFRNENKFTAEIKADESLLTDDYKIPPLIIQPYVENAILHGLRNRPDNEGKLFISATRNDNLIEFIIQDNGVGRDAKNNRVKKEKQSYGMQINEDRIRHFNKEEYASVEITDLKKNGKATGTIVQVHLKIQ
jgi:ligand-binding sensor domain-containing protein/two-component sensor histidine kinase